MSSYIRDTRLAQGQSGDHGKQERRAWRPAFRLFGGHLGDRLSLGFNAAVALFTAPNFCPSVIPTTPTLSLPGYYTLANVRYTSNSAVDLDGSGFVDLDDYFLQSNRWQETGDPP